MRPDLCIKGPRCTTYIVVTPTANAPQPQSFAIPVSVDGLQFRIQLETKPNVHRYIVDLSRAWFWSAAPAGSSRIIGSDQVAGAKVTVTKRLQSASILY